jgi:hypothetical protein
MTRWKRRLTPAQLEQTLRRLEKLALAKLEKYPEAEKEKINRWLKTYTGLMNLATLTRVETRERILDSLTDESVRTFILELSIALYAYGGDSDDFEERLVNSLAEGLRFDGRSSELCELPPEVLVSGPLANFPRSNLHSLALRVLRAIRATTEVSVYDYLLSNRHMQLVMLLTLADDLVTPPNL